MTPKWLVWADSTDRSDANVGGSQLICVDLWDDQATTNSPIASDQGLNITGRYTDETKTGIVFIVLDSNLDARKFRQVLEEELSKATNKEPGSYQTWKQGVQFADRNPE